MFVFFGMAIIAAKVWNMGLPVWALLISVLLPVVYVLPSGFIFAMTGQGVSDRLFSLGKFTLNCSCR